MKSIIIWRLLCLKDEASPSNAWHLVHPKVVVEVDGSKRVHQGVVDKLQVLPFSKIEKIFREEDMKDWGEKHVDDNEDHEWIEETGAPEESKQLESEKAGNYLKIDCFWENSCYGQSRRVNNILEEWKWI